MSSDNTGQQSTQQNPKAKQIQRIADLDYVTLKKLADRLDIPGERNWRRLIEMMPSCRYDPLTVERFGLNASKSDGSPSYAMLVDMSNRGVTYQQLINGLKKMQFDAALQDIGYRETVRITQQPEATPGVEGQQLILECRATGVPRPNFLWFKNPRTPLPDQTSDNLIIPRLTRDDAGQYCCRADNGVNVVFSAWVEVKVQKPHILKSKALPPDSHEITVSPKIIVHTPSQVKVQVGQELRLFVEAVCGLGGKLTYQWFRDGEKLNYGTTSEMLVNPARLEDQGAYSCRITSEHGGSSLSDITQVIVFDPHQPQTVGISPQVNHSPQVPPVAVSQYTQVSQSLAGSGHALSPSHTSQQHYTSSVHSQDQMMHLHNMNPYRALQGHTPNPIPQDSTYEYENPVNGGGAYQPGIRYGAQQDPLSPYNDGGHFSQNYMQNGAYVNAEEFRGYTGQGPAIYGGGGGPGEVYTTQHPSPGGGGGGGGGMFTTQHHGIHNILPHHQSVYTPSPNDYPGIDHYRDDSLPSTRAPNGEPVEVENLPCGQDQPPDLNDSCYDKVALLIGNKHYQRGELKLNTPENDAQDMAGVLLSADFKVVSLVNLNKAEMEAAVRYFESLVGKNVYALFFFAGHGFELNGKNYMMPVDADVEKNPKQCLCAQQVLLTMQSRGAKLSIVLLDMCRVNASTSHPPSSIDLLPPPQGTSGYFVIGFSCSPMERAYEAGAGLELKEEDRDNSIFVSALKKHLQQGSLKERLDTLLTDAAAGVRERGQAFNTPLNSWQKPEIRHNLGEKLSLADPIKDCEYDTQRKKRSRLWMSAHIVPDSVVVGCVGDEKYRVKQGELALRLHFEAEHSNVLIVTAELLNGCLTTCVVLSMDMTLHQYDEKTGLWLLTLKCHEDNKQYKYKQNTEYSYGHYQAEKEMDLMHFKIPDLQKIRTQSVTLKVSVEYQTERRGKYRERRFCEVIHKMNPPLYAKILSEVKETQSTAPYVLPFHHGFSPATHHT